VVALLSVCSRWLVLVGLGADEPTSGLDSVTALALVQLLQRITRSGRCSMLVSIHQPQAKLFALFDRLLLLKSGRILFQGSIPAALQLFEQCGFPGQTRCGTGDTLADGCHLYCRHDS
jgi:ABC-type multidrug transport system ATPase subunit